jgi:hypothetical protein
MHRSPVVLAFALVGAAAAQPVNLFNDTQLPTADWSAFIVSQGGGFSFGAGQALSGGNPGAYRTITHASASGFTFGTVAHVHAASWWPRRDGAITSLDLGVDVNCFNGGTSGAVGFGLVVEQNGVVYFGPTFGAATGSGWRTDLRRTGLTAASFLSAGQSPDFSRAGAPLHFGFFTSNGTGNPVPISSSSGADNAYATLTVPCPADYDGNGVINSTDVSEFINQWFTDQADGTFASDFDRNGTVNSTDVSEFINAWFDQQGAAC